MKFGASPHKMEDGKIVAILVKREGHEDEILTIPPAPFEGFEAMKSIIEIYYQMEGLWQDVKKEYDAVKSRFDLIDARRNAAAMDFKLLIAPRTEEKTTLVVKAQVETGTIPEPKPEPQIHITAEDAKQIASHPVPVEGSAKPPATRIITPPGINTTEQAVQASVAMQERAEAAGKELKDANIIVPIEVMQKTQRGADATLGKMMKEHPTLLTSSVKDSLPPKALGVLESIESRIETVNDAMDTTKPLKNQPQKPPVSVQDWAKAIGDKVTDKLENTDFDEARLEEEILANGVPKKMLEKVKAQLIISWVAEGRCDKKENDSFFLKLANLPKKVMGHMRKKKPETT